MVAYSLKPSELQKLVNDLLPTLGIVFTLDKYVTVSAKTSLVRTKI